MKNEEIYIFGMSSALGDFRAPSPPVDFTLPALLGPSTGHLHKSPPPVERFFPPGRTLNILPPFFAGCGSACPGGPCPFRGPCQSPPPGPRWEGARESMARPSHLSPPFAERGSSLSRKWEGKGNVPCVSRPGTRRRRSPGSGGPERFPRQPTRPSSSRNGGEMVASGWRALLYHKIPFFPVEEPRQCQENQMALPRGAGPRPSVPTRCRGAGGGQVSLVWQAMQLVSSHVKT